MTVPISYVYIVKMFANARGIRITNETEFLKASALYFEAAKTQN